MERLGQARILYSNSQYQVKEGIDRENNFSRILVQQFKGDSAQKLFLVLEKLESVADGLSYEIDVAARQIYYEFNVTGFFSNYLRAKTNSFIKPVFMYEFVRSFIQKVQICISNEIGLVLQQELLPFNVDTETSEQRFCYIYQESVNTDQEIKEHIQHLICCFDAHKFDENQKLYDPLLIQVLKYFKTAEIGKNLLMMDHLCQNDYKSAAVLMLNTGITTKPHYAQMLRDLI